MTAPYRVNGERLWQSLQTLATIGATPGGGVTRLALSAEDGRGRDLLREWAQEAGFSCEVDELGNMFMRRAGNNPALAPVLTGSHGDSQPLGGNYDGIYGVLAGLEALRTLNDRQISTERDIVLVNWTNEEGARFAPAMLGSGVWSGVFEKDYALTRQDQTGVSVGDALAAIQYAGARPAKAISLHASYEIHIEQGPILEAEHIDIGVVHAAMGLRWYDATIRGFATHAGTTPLSARRDALCGFAQLTLAVEQIGHRFAPDGRATVGMAQIAPNSRNVVPGQVNCSVELRHPDAAKLAEMETALRLAVEGLAQRQLEGTLDKIFEYTPVAFHSACVAEIERAAQALGYSHRRMVSGAGHDACYVNRVAPTAMIFIPCEKGISHNEAENILPAWAERGANVLLNTLLASAG
ncbi:N-carbamyl-L-cysteine amidohydrolase (plasmid) [Sodalis praecaptivus]|uniref:N-carbamyl-L-cysteine amidohydrolase n=1 Tax=Sodalis praecaptivus TaxID=1239307 RepID=W0I2V6_9GAMM|nr:Zn-dependent hydrolase [Sodalis praecaptivus]AHF79087.1 N-carbamyl-L-cysteine amidohydrolase [Sodalis praecaptivus]